MNEMTAAGQAGTKSPTPARKPRTIEQELMKRNKPILLAALAQIGIATVRFEYSGSGDSGGFESLTIEPAAGVDDQAARAAYEVTDVKLWWTDTHAWSNAFKGRVLHQRTSTLAKAIDDLSESLISSHYGGFENNEGGQGSVVFQVDPAEIRIDHEWNVMSTESDQVIL